MKNSFERVVLCFLALIFTFTSASPAISLEKPPAATLYIAAEPGCYSATYISTKKIPFVPPKKLYRVSCFDKHHFEVFWAGQMNTRPGNPIPESKESANLCVEKGKSMKILPRKPSDYNYEVSETSGTGNWLPDRGPEARRYPKRVVCYMGVLDRDFRLFKEIDKPLLAGLK